MQLDRSDIISVLPSKGFKKKEKRKHTYFYHVYNGKESGITTFVSRGTKYKSYGNELLGVMKKQLKLSTLPQLKDLIECPMTTDKYNKILKESGFL